MDSGYDVLTRFDFFAFLNHFAWVLLCLSSGAALHGDVINVPDGGDLQAAINSANPGDTVVLAAGATYVGNFVLPYKGADILIEATANALNASQLELHLIGDGPQRAFLEKLDDQLNVRSKVHFHGWIAHEKMQDELGMCDFLALPSIREFGGGVVLEAMALGLPAIVADYGGPAELVDSKTGIKVTFHDKKSLVDGMRLAIESVIRRPEMLAELGSAAR